MTSVTPPAHCACSYDSTTTPTFFTIGGEFSVDPIQCVNMYYAFVARGEGKNERIGDASIAVRVYKTQVHTHIQNAEGRGSPLSRSSKVLWYTPITSVRKVSGVKL